MQFNSILINPKVIYYGIKSYKSNSARTLIFKVTFVTE